MVHIKIIRILSRFGINRYNKHWYTFVMNGIAMRNAGYTYKDIKRTIYSTITL